MTEKSENLLLIFTRNPELGKCKTRLAATIGDNAALEVYRFLLEHTKNITVPVNAEKQVFYSEEIWENDIWQPSVFKKRLQVGDTLGERMMAAFQEGFKQGHKKIIVIGSDMYHLAKNDIEHAFAALDNADFVVGPAEDGGYYLLGMKKLKPKLFSKKSWGTASVLADTLADLENEKIILLEERNDVDLYEDIKDIEAFQPFIKHIEP